MVDKVPGNITTGTASRDSKVHATQADNSLSRSHTEVGISRLQSAVNAYSGSLIYDIGDLILEATVVFRNTTQITVPETFNPAKWTAIALLPDLSNLSGSNALSTSFNYNDGIKQIFNPDATNAGINVGAHTGDPSSPVNGDIFYNSTANELRGRINGVWKDLGFDGTGFLPLSGGTLTGKLLLTATATLAGLNIGSIAGNPSTQADGDIWLNTSTNQMFGRINGADVDLGFDGTGFLPLSGGTLTGDIEIGNNDIRFAGNTARINKVGSTLDIFCATGCKLIADGDTSNIITIFSGRTTIGIANFTDVIARNDASQDTRFFRRLTNIVDRTDGIEKGDTVFEVMVTGTSTETILLSGTTGNVVIKTNLQFENPSGSDPVLFSNSSLQALTLTGQLQLTPTSTISGVNVGSLTGNPSTQADGDIWYNSTSNILFGRINGGDVDLGAAGIAGVLSINGDTTSAALIVGTTNQITVGTAGGTTTIDVGSDVVIKTAASIYTAGARQDFLGLLAGTSGLNVGGIAGNPTSQVNGDIWLNTTTNQIFGRINGVDIDLGAGGGTGVTSINADTTAAQIIAGGTGIDVGDVTNTHTISIDSTVVTLTGSQTLTNKTINLTSNALNGTPAQFNTALTGDTFAFISNNLSVFAATTSLQLKNLITDETGSGALVFGSSPTIVTPTIASFTNATHTHTTAAGGGTLLSTSALSDTADIAYLNTANTYTAGVRQNFLGLLAGTAGLNIGGIAGNPTTQADGDIWLNTSTNQILGRINGANVNLSFTDGAGFLPLSGGTMTGNIVMNSNSSLDFASGVASISYSTSLNDLVFESEDDFSITSDGVSPQIQFISESQTAASSIFDIMFIGNNSVTTKVEYAKIDPQIIVNTDGSHTGSLIFNTTVSGSTAQVLGLNVNSQEEVFVYNNIRFNNAGTGSDPVLFSNSSTPTQILTLQGDLLFDNLSEVVGSPVFFARQQDVENTLSLVAGVFELFEFSAAIGTLPFLAFRAHNDNVTPEVISYAALQPSIVDPTDGSEDGKLDISIMIGGSLLPVVGFNINAQNELFIYDSIRFNNLGAGADPILQSNSPVQDLTLTGNLIMNGVIEMLNNEIRFAGNTANINKQGGTLDLFCATGCKFISPGSRNDITIFSGLAVTGDIHILDVVARNDASQDVIYFRRRTNVFDRTDGTENGSTTFSIMVDGTLTDTLLLDGATGNVFIETSLGFINPGAGGVPLLFANSALTELTLTGGLSVSDRFQESTGANVATSGTGEVTLGADGNCFTLSNSNTVEEIATANWQTGSKIILIVGGGNTSITSGATPGAGFADITLTNGTFSNKSNNVSITLVFTGSTWLEIARAG